jgi:hypothetical protein
MPVRIPIRCSGEDHYLTVTDDWQLKIDPAHDLDLELSLVEMGAPRPVCLRYLHPTPRYTYALRAAHLTPEQRFALAMTSTPYNRSRMALNSPHVTPEQQYQLGMSGDPQQSSRIATWVKDLTPTQRFNLGLHALHGTRHQAAFAAGLSSQQRYHLLKDEPRHQMLNCAKELHDRGFLTEEHYRALLR